MSYQYREIFSQVHRIIPSRFPPVSLFDWAESMEELDQIARLEGMTNERLKTECGDVALVAKEDWIGGQGSTPLMASFTHPGVSRFSAGSYGIYYAGSTQETAIAETRFHRERFLKASHEPPCLVQMREYKAKVRYALVDLCSAEFTYLLNPDVKQYPISQVFGQEIRVNKEWGLLYPSVRKPQTYCVAIFRPPALTIPIQGSHLDYIWDGSSISTIRKSVEYHQM